MGLRLRSIRTRIFLLVLLPVLSLIALYGFATFLTARGALNLGQASTIKSATGEPIGAFLSQIDAERPLALVYLAAPTGANLAVLQVQQNKTTATATSLSDALNSPDTMNNATPAEKQAIAVLLKDVKGLPALRAQVRSQIISKYRALDGYNALVSDSYSALDQAILEQTDAPLMAGWNKDEGFNFTLMQGPDTHRPYAELARAIFRERTEAALRLYPSGSPETDAASARALGGDLTIIHPTWAWIEAQKQSGRAAIFRFRFDRAPLTPQGWFGERDSLGAGAFHAGELLYVFDNLHACPWLIDDADRALAKLASSYWVNFVISGDPNGSGLPLWPSYRSASAPVMMLDTPPETGPEEWRERHMFLKQAVGN